MSDMECEIGEEVTIEYVPNFPLDNGRTSISGTVKEVMGQTVYVSTSLDDVTLILDDDGDLWARDDNRNHKDGLYGTIAEIVE